MRLCAALTALAALLGCASAEDELLPDLISSLSDGVSFFEKQFRHINLDGVVGYVILHAQLKNAVEPWQDPTLSGDPQVSAVTTLISRLDQNIKNAVKALQENTPKYYREFEPLMDTSYWSIPHEWRSTDPALAYPSFRAMECYDEQFVDKCMTLLIGTWKDNGTPCMVTKSCRDMMTKFGCPHYSLSHQLLYFMTGAMKGCTNILKGDLRTSRANMTDQDYQKIFCSSMMKSNQDIVKKDFSGYTRDIFIENIMLCGLAGFSDFFRWDWLQQILAWQDPNEGCFGKEEEDNSQGRTKEVMGSYELKRRVRRREKTLTGGCSSHMTGIAVSTLGGYLNYYMKELDTTKKPLP